jgi:hypothetical protein
VQNFYVVGGLLYLIVILSTVSAAFSSAASLGSLLFYYMSSARNEPYILRFNFAVTHNSVALIPKNTKFGK